MPPPHYRTDYDAVPARSTRIRYYRLRLLVILPLFTVLKMTKMQQSFISRKSGVILNAAASAAHERLTKTSRIYSTRSACPRGHEFICAFIYGEIATRPQKAASSFARVAQCTGRHRSSLMSDAGISLTFPAT
jgi:hypothetical protein